MRVTDWTLLGLTGLGSAAVLVAAANGLFADPLPELAVPSRRQADVQRTASRPADPPPVAQAPPPAVSVASPVRAQAALAEQGEWRFPPLAEAKAARPPAGSDDLQRPAPVLAPGEQQAAWAARDKLANAGAMDRPAASPVLTRVHNGPSPDKAGTER